MNKIDIAERDFQGKYPGIINKVIEADDFKSFEAIAGSQTPFGIVTSFKNYTSKPTSENTLKIYGNKFIGYTSPKYIAKNHDLINKYKVYVPKAIGSGIIATLSLINTQQMSPSMFKLVPLLNFKEAWNDSKLYEKYGLTSEEIEFIDSVVWPKE